ncbi:protein EFR3 homolog cmp44E isoform X2 [Agrilus planipennis]|uniref:Protein EFR3 homolog cmp44E isoform X2 n=1 Tax=Agrilus planipennis TaxID=224129 RepID=A0A7F5R437_AGRPL|nr:protein EFR3 homolog cmp44E isoform X2 [Agrilus planipennis]
MFHGCCGCCNALRPRYKRLVDNIFPVNPQDGLVKSNMEKLTFYSLSSPEKLDRIGEYFYQKASRDIYRRRHGFVIIAMEAMDQLLVACHAQTLNLFVESYLKMVQKLLESTEPKLQILATQSFVKFANIEEDTPSYHRRYDFFVSKFSAMCHSNEDRPYMRNQIRLAGIQGLEAVVRKTVSDDLVENIWEPVHMDKIVPSLLFNMQESGFHMKEVGSVEAAPEDELDPPTLAESCLRELVGKASFGHIKAVLKPVLRHFDLHELWCPNQFAVHTFRIIIFSIQAQYSYTVVESLMAHLDENSKSSPEIRTSIADVLSKIIAIAAGESVGPSVLEIINSLLCHLRDSVKNGINQAEEKQYQDALINALGEFANHLPDYQKIEIMMFIMSKIPFPPKVNQTPADNLLQSILLKSLLKVGTKYQTIHFNTTFPVSFLEPLLRMSLAPDPEMRLLVQKILHTLIDRHNNLEKLSKATVLVSDLDLVLEKSSRPDLIFINKHGPVIYDALYTSLQIETNSVENIEAIYTTVSLLCVELASAEVVIDIIQLLLGIQNLAITNTSLSASQAYNLHVLVISVFELICVVFDLPSLQKYANKIIAARRKQDHFLLPEMLSHYPDNHYPNPKEPFVYLEQTAICDILREDGLDPSRLSQTSPYGAGGPGAIAGTSQRHSWSETNARGSVVDIGTTQDVDSESSSPGVQKKLPEEKLTFEHMKRVLTEPPEARKEAEAEKREELNNFFRTATLAEIMQRTKPKHEDLQTKLQEIFKSLSSSEVHRSPTHQKKVEQEIPVYEQNFPEMFAY